MTGSCLSRACLTEDNVLGHSGVESHRDTPLSSLLPLSTFIFLHLSSFSLVFVVIRFEFSVDYYFNYPAVTSIIKTRSSKLLFLPTLCTVGTRRNRFYLWILLVAALILHE